tara:strand:- start:3592 stop:3849 length:258 start_codon:yes stop_codon:yes gene_type:complete
MAPVVMVVLGTTQLDPEMVRETPGPETTHVVSTPEAETVSVEVFPACTRVGEAVMVGVEAPQEGELTVTKLEQDAVAPPAETDIA